MKIQDLNIMKKDSRYSKSPLGIIALFISLIYGFASLVLGVSSDTFTETERLPLIWFLVIFPVLVLILFFFLVIKHYHKLFGPSDFSDEDNYLKMLDEIKTNQVVFQNLIDPPGNYTEMNPLVDDLLKKKETGTLIRIGRSYLKTGKPEIALKFFQSIKNKLDSNDDLLYKVYTNIGYSCNDLKDYQSAKANFKEALCLLGDEAQTWQLIPLAFSYYKLGDIDKARKYISRAKKHKHYNESMTDYKKRLACEKKFLKEL